MQSDDDLAPSGPRAFAAPAAGQPQVPSPTRQLAGRVGDDPAGISQNGHRGGMRAVAICGNCGGKYDEWAYQILVPELRASFDKVDCAERALKLHRRQARRPEV